ncbi:MAG: hypothetical protein K1X89_22740 [Myxococcaceae bacterium]|nr:hypothetical protein [Myxococcaceae bacterium]
MPTTSLRLALVAAAFALFGAACQCNPSKQCTSSTDCSGGGVCLDGYCVTDDGTGGGSGGGTGGGTGGSAGGGTGGSAGGGTGGSAGGGTGGGAGGGTGTPTLTVKVDLSDAGAAGHVVISGLGRCDAGTCSFPVTAGASFTVTAVEEGAGNGFAGWAGPCAGIGRTCGFSVPDAGLTVTAGFDRVNFIFVTSGTVTGGTLLGLNGADTVCQNHAADAGLPGTYRALLSTTLSNAVNRLPDAGGWMRPDLLPVAADRVHLISDGIWYQPRLTESGGTPGTPNSVATGTLLDGGLAATTCTDYAVNTGNVTVGNSTQGALSWITNNATSCGSSVRLYCVGVDRAGSPALDVPQNRRLAFVSNTVALPDIGVAGFDGICANEASDAGLGGTFVALISTDAGAPAARLNNGVVWTRTDGVKLTTAGPAFLSNGEWLAPLVLNARGDVLKGDFTTWTGASAIGTAAGNCQLWSVSDAGTGASGLSTSIQSGGVTQGAFGSLTKNCGEAHRVYCAQP